MPTRRNADHRKRQYVAATLTRAIRQTITWQCDVVVSPVDRHSSRSAFRHGAGQTSPLRTFIYRLSRQMHRCTHSRDNILVIFILCVSHGRRNTASRYIHKIKNNIKKKTYTHNNPAVARCLLITSILQ